MEHWQSSVPRRADGRDNLNQDFHAALGNIRLGETTIMWTLNASEHFQTPQD